MKTLLIALLLSNTYAIHATVTGIDENTWTGYCTDPAGRVYTFEIGDEYNIGDSVTAIVDNNGTTIKTDDRIIEVHYVK